MPCAAAYIFLERGATMKKQILYALAGVGMSLFAYVVWMAKEIPESEMMRLFGGFLMGQSVMAAQDTGNRAETIVMELLGGQEYFIRIDEEQEQKLVLRENQQDAVDSSDGRVGGDVFDGESEETLASGSTASVRTGNAYVERLKSTLDVEYLWNKFYIVDSTTKVTKDMFDVKSLLEMDMKLEKKKGKKQILIYHTHGASEKFSDSSQDTEDSVVGVGSALAKELEKLGYGVYHDKTKYDWIDGNLERSLAYNEALTGIQKIRSENPDIKVLIDLHRDSVGKGKHTYTVIDGKRTAIVMFFNGLSRNRSGPIAYLENPNLQGNLAFSLQCKCKAMEYYDGFTKPIYLKGYRYNLHLEPRSLLIELGNENNTVEEAKNAAAPLAKVLDKVLSGQH